MKFNIYEYLKPFIVKFESALDVGTKSMVHLFDFEDSPFKRLHGIDIDNHYKSQLYSIYLKFRTSTKPQLIYPHFKKRFTWEQGDVNSYNFINQSHSLIICRNLLHFFPDNKKMELIGKFHAALQNDGLIYLEINHNKHRQNTDPKESIEISKNVFQGIMQPEDIRYLIESEEFANEIQRNYQIIPDLTKIKDDTLIIVLRK